MRLTRLEIDWSGFYILKSRNMVIIILKGSIVIGGGLWILVIIRIRDYGRDNIDY